MRRQCVGENAESECHGGPLNQKNPFVVMSTLQAPDLKTTIAVLLDKSLARIHDHRLPQAGRQSMRESCRIIDRGHLSLTITNRLRSDGTMTRPPFRTDMRISYVGRKAAQRGKLRMEASGNPRYFAATVA